MAGVVVITGGSAGIGRAAATLFARKGYAVGLIARGPERLEAAKRELEALGARVHTAVADVADADAMEVAADEMEVELGPIDVWVNNAMATVYARIAHLEPAEIRRVTEVTYLGAVHGTLAALKRMKGGAIVQVSSVLAWRAIPIQGAYCGAKFALRGFTESLRAELIHDGSPLRLSMVHLPAVDTPQFDWARNKTGRQAVGPGAYRPEVAAEAVVFAAENDRRDVFVGRGTPPAILAARLAPGLMDRVLARKGWDTLGKPLPAQDGNLFEPAPGGDQGASGRMGDQAKAGRDIYTSRGADALAAGVLLAGAAGLFMLANAPFSPRRHLPLRALRRLLRGR